MRTSLQRPASPPRTEKGGTTEQEMSDIGTQIGTQIGTVEQAAGKKQGGHFIPDTSEQAYQVHYSTKTHNLPPI